MITHAVNIRTSKYDIYIGRAGHGMDGYFGNPIILGEICPVCGNLHLTGDSTLTCYQKWLITKVQEDPEYRRRVKELQGCRLGCFCKPKSCHGDYLSRMVEYLNRSQEDV